ncbi:hypothetical protein Clacol_001814 [Clathrus columnatus]|uniref:Ketoreductase domain-containing protein n=1 Tax=Clathrus columnatus TaxID=1419009 RepID=A0AAV5A4S8_9AGAM|nr:hypothetical protein Clacol_001814 [Clathrus columnatus]
MSSSPLILVTGASRGIGLSVTKVLLTKLGANVVALSRSRTPGLEELGRRFPSKLNIVQCDITDENAVKAVVNSCDRIDGLVLNAGTISFARISSENSTLAEWKRVFDVNFFSLLHTVRSALPRLRESKGRIIFVSSGAAVGKIAGWGAYNTSKAAMNSFCRTLAAEEHDIISIAVRPGRVDTEMQQSLRQDGGDSMDFEDHQLFVNEFNNGKLVKPDDPGHVIAALSTAASSELNGQFLSWDAKELEKYRA